MDDIKKLFGTDGIRGVAGKPPLTKEDVIRIGQAAGLVLKRHHPKEAIRVLIVRDTRESGLRLVTALSRGLQDLGIDVYDAGILCTPSVAYLVQAHRFQSGVVVSASHNPPEFNGIKFFTNQGRKWPDAWERSVETLFSKKGKLQKASIRGKQIKADQMADDYEKFLISTLPRPLDLRKMKLAVDCSHGANTELAPKILKNLGAQLIVMGNKPNGRNINVRCGSQETKALARLVRAKKCLIGIAFDGDGDRVMFVDEKGNLIDGDFIIGLFARHLKEQKRLKKNRAVITVMSNLGLKVALSQIGIRPIETPVGDRFVSEAMRKNDSILGGEQSGHIILGSYLPSGDGLLTALHVLFILSSAKKPFSKLVGWMKKFPQTLVNVPIKEKVPIRELNGVQNKIKLIEDSLGDKGRVLVRYSGTEPVLRIMIEGPDKSQIDKYASELVAEVKSTIE